MTPDWTKRAYDEKDFEVGFSDVLAPSEAISGAPSVEITCAAESFRHEMAVQPGDAITLSVTSSGTVVSYTWPGGSAGNLTLALQVDSQEETPPAEELAVLRVGLAQGDDQKVVLRVAGGEAGRYYRFKVRIRTTREQKFEKERILYVEP